MPSEVTDMVVRDVHVEKTLMAFKSAADVYAVHEHLFREESENPSGDYELVFWERVRSFIEATRNVGQMLPSPQERLAVQRILSYWSSAYAQRASEYIVGENPSSLGGYLLPFDETKLPLLPDSACPYVGLAAFAEENHSVFFGREALLEQCLAVLRSRRVLFVVGASGSGKSSLVRGGLLPQIEAGALNGRQLNILPIVVPDSEPIQSLKRALSAELGWVLLKESDMPEEREQACPDQGLFPHCLVVDQFEELFTLHHDDKQQEMFTDALTRFCTEGESENRLIITLRSEFDTFVAKFPQLHRLFGTDNVRVGAMSSSQLRDAVLKPAATVNLVFEDGVVDALVSDVVGEAAALPMLQFTLLKLWERRNRNRISLRSYEELGGARGSLAKSADAFLAELRIKENQDAARNILLRMVRVGEGLEAHSKRILRTDLYSEEPEADFVVRERIDAVLDKLIAARLVKVSHVPGEGERIEVAHEALLRNWPKFQDWLAEERAALLVRRRLDERVSEWLRLGRGRSGLLGEAQLIEAREWLRSPAALRLGYSPLLPELVEMSEEELKLLQSQKEEAIDARRRVAQLQQAIRVACILVITLLLIVYVLWSRVLPLREEERRLQTEIGASKAELRGTKVGLKEAQTQLALAVQTLREARLEKDGLITEKAELEAEKAKLASEVSEMKIQVDYLAKQLASSEKLGALFGPKFKEAATADEIVSKEVQKTGEEGRRERKKYTVEIYSQDRNLPNIQSVISELGFVVKSFRTRWGQAPISTIWYGHVPLENVQLVALTLIRAGVEVRNIEKLDRRGNQSLIQVGANGETQPWPALTVESFKRWGVILQPAAKTKEEAQRILEAARSAKLNAEIYRRSTGTLNIVLGPFPSPEDAKVVQVELAAGEKFPALRSLAQRFEIVHIPSQFPYHVIQSDGTFGPRRDAEKNGVLTNGP